MAPPRECLYVTLGLPQTATTSEIRKAYRTLALSHHPDKNPDQQAAASEQFKAIQHAYSVLSDDHERAWYDAHRTQILRGQDPATADPDAAPDSADATQVDLFACFSSAAYRGFSDAPDAFYAIYADVFDRLWQEEVVDMTREGKRVPPSASFGGVQAEWDTVRAFYARWDAFSSVKTFVFADKWHLGEAPNREVRRLMEKDNKKARATVRKEFNSTVRELAAFVKKRDPRVVRKRKEEQQLREERQEQAKERKMAEKRLRMENAEQLRAARDEALEEDAVGLDEIIDALLLDERMEADDGKARGKKKRGKNGALPFSENNTLRSEVMDTHVDDDRLDETGDIPDGSSMSERRGGDGSSLQEGDVDREFEEADDEEKEEEDLYCAACRKSFRTVAQRADHERSKKHRSAVAKLKRQLLKEEKAFKKANPELVGKMPSSTISGVPPEADKVEDLEESSHADASEIIYDDAEEAQFLRAQTKKSKKKRRKQIVQTFVNLGDDLKDIGGEVGSSVTESSRANGNLASEDDEHRTYEHSAPDAIGGRDATASEAPEETKTPKLTKKQQRRLREKNKREQANIGKTATAVSLKCNVCSGQFPSRNKLMRHVEQSGHALQVPGTPSPSGGRGRK